MDPSRPPPVDLLSSFPEHLQDEILGRLALRDAVHTSALSRAWRRRWETVPGLVLSFPDGTPAMSVYRVLLRYAGPRVSGFSTHVDEAYTPQVAVDDWLIALSRRSVEAISICNEHGRFTLHSSIFGCDRLVSLSLERCSIPPLPQPQPGGGFAGFPALKELYLTLVWFADNGESQLRAMIRASPMLRVLLLDEVFTTQMDRVIEAHNLRSLVFVQSCIEWRFDLPRLRYASINVPEYHSDVRIGEFLAGVSQAEELIFNQPVCVETDAFPFTFSNLKSIELLTDLYDMDYILFMFCLLRSSPNLEKLKIELREPEMYANPEFLNAQWTDGMCANLQVVEIISEDGWLPLSFMKLILSKASRLCTLTLSVDACPVSHDDGLNELLNCTRASPQAQVLFKVQVEEIQFDRMKFAEKRLN